MANISGLPDFAVRYEGLAGSAPAGPYAEQVSPTASSSAIAEILEGLADLEVGRQAASYPATADDRDGLANGDALGQPPPNLRPGTLRKQGMSSMQSSLDTDSESEETDSQDSTGSWSSDSTSADEVELSMQHELEGREFECTLVVKATDETLVHKAVKLVEASIAYKSLVEGYQRSTISRHATEVTLEKRRRLGSTSTICKPCKWAVDREGGKKASLERAFVQFANACRSSFNPSSEGVLDTTSGHFVANGDRKRETARYEDGSTCVGVEPDSLILEDASPNTDRIGSRPESNHLNVQQAQAWDEEAGRRSLSKSQGFGEFRTSPLTDDTSRKRLLAQTARYVAALVLERPYTAVTYFFTLTGNVFTLYSFNAQGYTSTKDLFVNDPDHLPELVSLLVFLAHPERSSASEKACLWPTFSIRTDDTTQTWKWKELQPELLNIDYALFGSRTICLGGVAQMLRDPDDARCEVPNPEGASEAEGANRERYIVVKLTWRKKYLVGQEAGFYRHIKKELPNANQKISIPIFLGSCAGISTSFEQTCAETAEFARTESDDSPSPLILDTVVVESIQSKWLSSKTTVLNALTVAAGAARAILTLADIGIHYRDVNVGNLLLTVEHSDSFRFPYLVTDFGNGRIHNRRRGGKGGPIDIVDFAKDDCRSGTYLFMSYSSFAARALQAELKSLSDNLIKTEIQLNDRTLSATKRKRLSERRVTEEGQCARIRLSLRAHMHRCIQDLESIFWFLLFTLSKAGQQHKQLEILKRADKKKAALQHALWTNSPHFAPVLDHPAEIKEEVLELVEDLAMIVNVEEKVRKEVAAVIEGSKKGDAAAEDEGLDEGPMVTDVERAAFHAFISRIKETQEALQPTQVGSATEDAARP